MRRHLYVVVVAAIAGSLAAGAIQTMISALAIQAELVPPTAGIYTGVQFSQKIGDAFRSLAGCSKGASAPANVGGAPTDGQCWIDDHATPWLIKQYVNGSWATTGALDPTDSSYAGAIGGGLATIASAATVDLGSVPQANVTISGSTTITSFGASAPAGAVKFIRFSATLTLTHSGALTVPGGFPLTTAAGDRAIVTHLGSGNWEITSFTRASGIPIDVAAVGKPSFDFAEAVPGFHVAGYGQALARASYPAYLAKVTRAQNGTRTTGNATIASVANTAGLGPGMPVESTGVNAGCTIASVTSTSITLNSSSCVTSSGTSTVTVFLYGYGTSGSSATVGVPDCRGRSLAGRDSNVPGSLANRLTSSYFGADSSIFGVTGISSENVTLAAGNLPPYTPAGSVATSGTVTITAAQGFQTSGTFQALVAPGLANIPSSTFTLAVSSAFTGTPTSGTSAPFRTVPPTLIAECVVRVVP